MARELIALTELALNGRRYRPGEVIEGGAGVQGDALIAVGAAARREAAAPPKATEAKKPNSAEPQAGREKDAESPRDKQARPGRTK